MQDLIVRIDGEIEKGGKNKADIDRYRFSVRIGMRRKQRKHWRKVYVIMK